MEVKGLLRSKNCRDLCLLHYQWRMCFNVDNGCIMDEWSESHSLEANSFAPADYMCVIYSFCESFSQSLGSQVFLMLGSRQKRPLPCCPLSLYHCELWHAASHSCWVARHSCHPQVLRKALISNWIYKVLPDLHVYLSMTWLSQWRDRIPRRSFWKLAESSAMSLGLL